MAKPPRANVAAPRAIAPAKLVQIEPVGLRETKGRFDLDVLLSDSGLTHQGRVDALLSRIGKLIDFDRTKAERLAAIAEECETHYKDGNLAFLKVGMKVLEFEETAGEEGMRIAFNSGDIIGIEASKLSNLRTIAKRVRDGLLQTTEIPVSWYNAYLIAKMEPAQIELAREANLIRPDAQRREISDFSQRHKLKRKILPLAEDDEALVKRALSTATRQRARLMEKVTELDETISHHRARLLRMRADIDEVTD